MAANEDPWALEEEEEEEEVELQLLSEEREEAADDMEDWSSLPTPPPSSEEAPNPPLGKTILSAANSSSTLSLNSDNEIFMFIPDLSSHPM